MVLKFADVTDPPDMISNPVLLVISVLELAPGYFFTPRDGLEHGAVAVFSTAHIVDFRAPRLEKELMESLYQVAAMNVVAHLFCLITKDLIRRACGCTPHEIGEESMQLRARVARAGQTSTAKAGGFHVEIAAIFLHENVRGCLRRPEQGVFRGIDTHGFRDAMLVIRMAPIELPAGVLFDQWQVVRTIAVYLVGRGEDEDRFRANLPGRFEQA